MSIQNVTSAFWCHVYKTSHHWHLVNVTLVCFQSIIICCLENVVCIPLEDLGWFKMLLQHSTIQCATGVQQMCLSVRLLNTVLPSKHAGLHFLLVCTTVALDQCMRGRSLRLHVLLTFVSHCICAKEAATMMWMQPKKWLDACQTSQLIKAAGTCCHHLQWLTSKLVQDATLYFVDTMVTWPTEAYTCR